MKKKNLLFFTISVVIAALGIVVAVFFYDAKRRKQAVQTFKDLFRKSQNNINKAVKTVKKSVNYKKG